MVRVDGLAKAIRSYRREAKYKEMLYQEASDYIAQQTTAIALDNSEANWRLSNELAETQRSYSQAL